MLPCGMMSSPVAYPLENGFAAAWESIRNDVKQLHSPTECVTCTNRDVCPACAAVCVTGTGAFDKVPTYVCRQTEAFIEQTRLEYIKRKG